MAGRKIGRAAVLVSLPVTDRLSFLSQLARQHRMEGVAILV